MALEHLSGYQLQSALSPAYDRKSYYNDHAISTGTALEFKNVIGLTFTSRQAGPLAYRPACYPMLFSEYEHCCHYPQKP